MYWKIWPRKSSSISKWRARAVQWNNKKKKKRRVGRYVVFGQRCDTRQVGLRGGNKLSETEIQFHSRGHRGRGNVDPCNDIYDAWKQVNDSWNSLNCHCVEHRSRFNSENVYHSQSIETQSFSLPKIPGEVLRNSRTDRRIAVWELSAKTRRYLRLNCLPWRSDETCRSSSTRADVATELAGNGSSTLHRIRSLSDSAKVRR